MTPRLEKRSAIRSSNPERYLVINRLFYDLLNDLTNSTADFIFEIRPISFVADNLKGRKRDTESTFVETNNEEALLNGLGEALDEALIHYVNVAKKVERIRERVRSALPVSPLQQQ